MKLPVMISLIALMLNPFFQQDKDPYERQRRDMVSTQIAARGITDPAILAAMRKIPRHLFVPANIAPYAYQDNPLPIGYDQTISQPFIVAWMSELAKPNKNKKTLEIGTGSGYQAAILAETTGFVYTIEIVPQLAKSSKELLSRLEYKNVEVKEGDGYTGWEEHAPFDIIMVTAACDHIPQPLLDQLAEGGRLVMPLGDPGSVQELILITKNRGRINRQTISAVRFVPLIRK